MSVSADLTSGQQDLPRRVFAPLSDSGLSVCDYIFPDENTADVAERFKEMLGCDLSEEDVDTGMEAQCKVTYFIIMLNNYMRKNSAVFCLKALKLL